ncbi:MAG: hypothetical protein IPO05_12845 [Flavobacteriales bacterium]|nr:hypothetical protein [Flavobacteriales bacterium]
MSISATLVFDDADRLVDFISDDRYAMAADGKAVSMRFSTCVITGRSTGLSYQGTERRCGIDPMGHSCMAASPLRSLTYDPGN